ncbi:MAG: hypothetical protein AAB262_11185, partial [Elusimicrobiota bacterium]
QHRGRVALLARVREHDLAVSSTRSTMGAAASRADAACNRAFEFHAQSTAFARAQDSFDKARTTSDATPAAARPFLDEAEKALSSERLFQR